MALSTGSKILVNDISTALSGKIDTAGTGLSKSGTTLALATVVTAGTAGPTANATPGYGSTFTVPKVTYDAYGRVTGHTNYTVKIPAAPSSVSTATSATCVSSIQTTTISGVTSTTAPSGGTWLYIIISSYDSKAGVVAGGSSITGLAKGYTYYVVYIRKS